MKIDVRTAVDRAREYFQALYPDRDPSGLQLEEVELTENDRYWMITLSHSSAPQVPFPLISPANKLYKVFKVIAATGEVVGMKIRQLK